MKTIRRELVLFLFEELSDQDSFSLDLRDYFFSLSKPTHYGPNRVNCHVTLIKTVLQHSPLYTPGFWSYHLDTLVSI